LSVIRQLAVSIPGEVFDILLKAIGTAIREISTLLGLCDTTKHDESRSSAARYRL